MSVVDGELAVYGVADLLTADGSIARDDRGRETLLARLHERVDRGDLADADRINAQIASVAAEREAVARISTWPWEPTTLTGFSQRAAPPGAPLDAPARPDAVRTLSGALRDQVTGSHPSGHRLHFHVGSTPTRRTEAAREAGAAQVARSRRAPTHAVRSAIADASAVPPTPTAPR